MRVLIVEDDPAVARAVARGLRLRGHVVRVAASCFEASSCFESFDLGIFDLTLHDGNGMDIASLLLSRHCVPSAIFFSGLSDVPERATRLGYFVAKSEGIQGLYSAMDRLSEPQACRALRYSDVVPRSMPQTEERELISRVR